MWTYAASCGEQESRNRSQVVLTVFHGNLFGAIGERLGEGTLEDEVGHAPREGCQ
jgi:hypothetical protein